MKTNQLVYFMIRKQIFLQKKSYNVIIKNNTGKEIKRRKEQLTDIIERIINRYILWQIKVLIYRDINLNERCNIPPSSQGRKAVKLYEHHKAKLKI